MAANDTAISTLRFRTVFWVIVGVLAISGLFRLGFGLALASPGEQQNETLMWLEWVFSGSFGGILGLLTGKRLT